AAVEVGIVDESLPAHGGARLFEINAHNDFQAIVQLFTQADQTAGIVHGGGRIVDGAGTDNDGEAVILTGQDIVESMAGRDDRAGRGIGARMGTHHFYGRRQRLDFGDAQVVG